MIYNLKDHVWVPKYQTIIVIDHGLDKEPVSVEVEGNREVVRFERLFYVSFADQLIPPFSEMYYKIITPFIFNSWVWYYYNEQYQVKLVVLSAIKPKPNNLLDKEEIVAKLRLDKKLVCI